MTDNASSDFPGSSDSSDSSDSSNESFHASLTETFFALHHRLPRQSPGSDATTRRLLSLAGQLPSRPRVIDLGCGPGRSALLLASEAGARVTAVDLHELFLTELDEAAAARALTGQVTTVRADMGELPYTDGSFDLVWAEGSAYVIGFDRALREWRRLLAPRGALVLTECEWTTDTPSAGARAFWDPQYPLRSTAENRAAAEAAGYTVLGVHHQPPSDWAEYYEPLAERVGPGVSGLPDTPGAAEALASVRREIAVWREHGADYGYTGYVLRRTDG